MAANRIPLAKAKIQGSEIIHAGRFKDRKEPKVSDDIGPSPEWMTDIQAKVWRTFVKEIPWLNSSHRALLEIAVIQRARYIAGEEVGVQAMNLLRQCLGQMGASPSDASKVAIPDEPDEVDEDDVFTKPH